jgi:hypothetical protein
MRRPHDFMRRRADLGFQVLLKIYATGDHGGSRASGPSLIVRADNAAALPHHPAGKTWRYLATIADSDPLIASRRESIETALAGRGFFGSRWLLGVASAPSHTPVPLHRRIGSNGRSVTTQRQRAEQAFHLPA